MDKRLNVKKAASWIVTLLMLLSIPATLLIWGFGLPAQYEETYMGELKDKVELLKTTEGPRLVLLGGSGVAFGADSALLERELDGYHVVNCGMYAALGTTVMLDLSLPYIREGDIVILIPEQQAQTLSGWFDPAIMWQGLDGAYELRHLLSAEKRGRLLGAFPEFAGQKYSCYLHESPPDPQGVYRRCSFNERGDIVSPLCVQNVMPGGFDASTPILFEETMVEEAFIAQVREYARKLTEKGAALWYGYCPMNAPAVRGGLSEADEFYMTLQNKLGIPLAGDPRDFILDAEWFYDTNFHPNRSGKTVYTRALIRAVKAMLGDSSPTEITVPAKPAFAETEILYGNDQDAVCFLYEERDGELAVVGLSADGFARRDLTVPTSWNGLPVTSIRAGAFEGAEALEQILIQQNIRAIADGAFTGCEALKRIVLRSDEPSACHVGQGLLDGVNAKVYVPEEALSKYRTDYFWSVYGTNLMPQSN